MHRWTAGLLLLVMLVPGLAPLALAGTAAPEAMHCMRRPLSGTAPAAQPAMHCHEAMAQAPPEQSSEASFRSLDCCCQNHDCCRSVKTSEWAQPASVHFSFVSLLIESALGAPAILRVSVDLTAPDSARAPPLA